MEGGSGRKRKWKEKERQRIKKWIEAERIKGKGRRGRCIQTDRQTDNKDRRKTQAS